MAHQIYKDVDIRIDDSTGVARSIKSSVNSKSVAGAMSVIEDSGLGDEERTYLPGLAGSTFSLNGFIDSTTNAIFAPLVGNRTSITKTFGFRNGTGFSWLKGEAYPTGVTISGSVDTIETWSADFQITGAVTTTSVAP